MPLRVAHRSIQESSAACDRLSVNVENSEYSIITLP
jgi:hypothetical protein